MFSDTRTGQVKLLGKEYTWKALSRLSFDNNKCTSCGICCRSSPPSLAPNEQEIIFKVRSDLRTEWVPKETMPIISKNQNGCCQFLDNDNRCQIYDIRPKMCRQYPLQIAFFPKYIEVWVTDECPTAHTGSDFLDSEINSAIQVQYASKINEWISTISRFEDSSLSYLGPYRLGFSDYLSQLNLFFNFFDLTSLSLSRSADIFSFFFHELCMKFKQSSYSQNKFMEFANAELRMFKESPHDFKKKYFFDYEKSSQSFEEAVSNTISKSKFTTFISDGQSFSKVNYELLSDHIYAKSKNYSVKFLLSDVKPLFSYPDDSRILIKNYFEAFFTRQAVYYSLLKNLRDLKYTYGKPVLPADVWPRMITTFANNFDLGLSILCAESNNSSPNIGLVQRALSDFDLSMQQYSKVSFFEIASSLFI